MNSIDIQEREGVRRGRRSSGAVRRGHRVRQSRFGPRRNGSLGLWVVSEALRALHSEVEDHPDLRGGRRVERHSKADGKTRGTSSTTKSSDYDLVGPELILK